jgi:short subunit dehydrogenase-like uncharacterized protein
MSREVPQSMSKQPERAVWPRVAWEPKGEQERESDAEWIARLQELAAEAKKQLENEREEASKKRLVEQEQPARTPTPQTILAEMGKILAGLASGKLKATDAKATLYAHQIALSAMRTIEQAARAQQKEDRLCKSEATKRSQQRRESPKREAPRQGHQPNRQTTKKTTGNKGHQGSNTKGSSTRKN